MIFILKRACRVLPISISARKRLRWAFAKHFARTTTSPAPTAATGIAWQRAALSTGCLPSCWAKRRDTAVARAVRCISPISQKGNLGANAIVGGSAGIATGAALSAQMRNTDQVAICFFGEGALGQGLLYEVMNMASLWKLPVIYVCENNLYYEYTHYRETTAGEIRSRPEAFGIPAETCRRTECARSVCGRPVVW